LPLVQFLGTPFFPNITDWAGYPAVYNVGPIEISEIAKNSVMPITLNQEGWTELQLINGTLAQSVVAGSNSPRFYVATLNLTSVKITYLDVGKDRLSMYLYNPYSKKWFEYLFIKKNDTGEWKTFEFLVPANRNGFTEFALHAYQENFTISRIEAVPFHDKGKTSFYSLDMEITNETYPPTLMVYLPILGDDDKIVVETNSFGKEICLEIFEGVIQPWEATEWWWRHELVVRSPESIIYGEANPSLVWTVKKSGLYTLVIVLREEYAQDSNLKLPRSVEKIPSRRITQVDLKISISGGG